VRNAAYENVRLFIDNTEQVTHQHIFFSIIPDVLSADKGFRAYDALWSRVRSMGEQKHLNYRSVLVDLHRTPLQTAELVALGKRLRRIHERSYRWEAHALVTDPILEQLCEHQRRMGLISEVRLFIKSVIRLLDMAEQGELPEELTDLSGELQASQRAIEAERLAEAQPSWDS